MVGDSSSVPPEVAASVNGRLPAVASAYAALRQDNTPEVALAAALRKCLPENEFAQLNGFVSSAAAGSDFWRDLLATVEQQSAAAAPGWHDDPMGEARLRWWDGTEWTAHVSS
jgi:hypothetical protein